MVAQELEFLSHMGETLMQLLAPGFLLAQPSVTAAT